MRPATISTFCSIRLRIRITTDFHRIHFRIRISVDFHSHVDSHVLSLFIFIIVFLLYISYIIVRFVSDFRIHICI